MSIMGMLASEPWVDRLGWTLVHFLWEGVAVTGIYAAWRARLARRLGANGRYLLACAALLTMVAAPVVTWRALGTAGSSLPPSAPNRTATIPGYQSIAAKPVAELPEPVRLSVPPAKRPQFLPWVVALWMIGATAFWMRLLGGWAAAAGARASTSRAASEEWQPTFAGLAQRLRVTRPVKLLVSAWVEAPGVVGWLRPVVLVPVGALAGLPAEHVEALLIHELAHIRRHDYLVNMAQCAIEALLFYHPAVWWISGQIRAEREACCDDIAVGESGDVLTYVSALAELEAQRGGRRQLAVAANGGSLADRVARLLGESRPASQSGIGPVMAIGVVLLAAGYSLFGQAPEKPAFQVASIKRNTEAQPRGMMVRIEPGGRLTARNASLVLLIQNAYRIQAYQIVGGPEWLNSDGYDIEAKPEAPADEAKAWLMLQPLLAERFRLTVHRETRELPVWALVAAKGGPHLPAPEHPNCAHSDDPPPRPDQAPCGRVRVTMAAGGLGMLGNSVTMQEFMRVLASVLGQPVIDRTGFSGLTDIHLTGFTPDENTMGLPGSGGARAYNMVPALPGDPGHPNITAALEEQLGLKLEKAKGPVEVLVIDHVERPTAN